MKINQVKIYRPGLFFLEVEGAKCLILSKSSSFPSDLSEAEHYLQRNLASFSGVRLNQEK
jgi:hypothetical protein